jgi:hypothetical protein
VSMVHVSQDRSVLLVRYPLACVRYKNSKFPDARCRIRVLILDGTCHRDEADDAQQFEIFGCQPIEHAEGMVPYAP